jgi:PAS domain S-box-containing protein
MNPKSDYKELERKTKKQAQEILQLKKINSDLQLEREIINHMTEGVHLVRGRDQVIIYASASIEQMLEYESNALIGKTEDVINRNSLLYSVKLLENISKNETWKNEVELISKDGSKLLFHEQASFFDHPDYGKVWMLVHRKYTESRSTTVENDQQFRNIFNSAPMGMLQYDLNTNGKLILTGANPAADQIFGINNSELFGKTIEEAFPPLADTEIPYRFIRAAAKGETWETVSFNYDDDRISGAFDLRAFQIAPGKMTVMFLDITEKKQTEMALKESEERYLLATKGSTDGMWDHPDLKEDHQWWSERLYELLGYKDRELEASSSSFKVLLHPDDMKRMLEAKKRHFEKRKPYAIEYRLRTKSGAYRWFQARGQALFDKAGNPTRMSGSIQDITERKLALEELQEVNERFQQVVENAQEWIWETDANGLYTYASPIVEKILGYRFEEIVGKKYFYDLFHPAEREELKKGALEVFDKKQSFAELINRNIHKDGTEIWLSTSGVPLLDDSGSLIGYRGVDADITTRKYLEDELIKHKDYLEVLVKERTAELEKEITMHKQTEEALIESRERLELALKGAELGMWDWDLENDSFIFNTRSEELLEYTSLSNSEDWLKQIHPDDLKRVKENGEAVIKGQSEVIDHDYRYISKTGEIRWINSWGRVVEWNKDGKPIRATGTSQDITEGKQTEDALKESEHNLKRAQHISKIGSWYYDRTTGNEKWSDECFKLFGLEKENYPDNMVSAALSFSFYADPEKKAELGTFLAEKYEKYDMEFTTIPINGQVKTIHSYCEVEKDSEGNLLKVFGSDHDITERKQAEKALKESEEEYRRLVETTVDWVWSIDTNNKITYSNKAIENLLGYKSEEILDNSFYPLMHSDDKVIIRETIQNAIEQKSGWTDIEIRWLHKDRSIRYFESSAQPVIDDQGNLFGFTGIDRDITDRKQAEEILKKRELFFSQMFEQSTTSTCLYNPEGIIVRVNPKFCKLFGVNDKEIIEGKFNEFRNRATIDAGIVPILREIFDEKKTKAWEVKYDVDVALKLKESSLPKRGQIMLEVFGYPIVDSGGQLKYVVLQHYDITKRKRMEELLIAAKEKAETTNLVKSMFLANMSHEIRTPMNAILGFTNLTLRTELTSVQHEYLKKTKNAAYSLLEIINDILDFSKIEAGKLKIERRKIWPSTIIEDIADLFTDQAAEKGIELIIGIDQRIPPALMGDSGRIRQILNNLISNALKFTQVGEIFVNITLKKETKDSVLLSFTVKDTGIGIAEEDLQAIFTPFSQVDGSTTRKFTGTGLGLSICKQLVKLMEGEIQVKSTPSQGSTFIFTIMLKKAKEDIKLTFSPNETINDLRVLIVDKNRTIGNVLKNMFNSFGSPQVVTAISREDTYVGK